MCTAFLGVGNTRRTDGTTNTPASDYDIYAVLILWDGGETRLRKPQERLAMGCLTTHKYGISYRHHQRDATQISCDVVCVVYTNATINKKCLEGLTAMSYDIYQPGQGPLPTNPTESVVDHKLQSKQHRLLQHSQASSAPAGVSYRTTMAGVVFRSQSGRP